MKTDVEVLRSHLQRPPKRKRVAHTVEPQSDTHGLEWWSSAVLDVHPSCIDGTPYAKDSEHPVQFPAEPPKLTRQASPSIGGVNAPPESIPETHLSIVQQYLEALYLSKASLAFFAKGPLSRARAAHGFSDQQGVGQRELAEKLRLMILSTSMTESKYRSAITGILKASSDTTQPIRWPAKSSKHAMKPGKDGLYKPESQHIRQWWNDCCDHSSGVSGEDNLKQALRPLRFRENCLQIIMILEIMSLESSLPSSALAVDPTANGAMNDSEPQQNQSKKKKKKPQDLNLGLELLLDRLCIWQSIEMDGDVGSNDPDLDTHQGDPTKASEGDRLREFCLEVIIPL